MKVAVVGCGGIGLAHARAYAELAEVGWVVDRDAERARSVAAQVGAEPLTDLAELPAEARVVSVATDPASHVPLATALLRRGHAVFCEKPLAMTAAEAQALVELAEAAGQPLSIGFKMRYEPVFQLARDVLPEVGPLLQIATTKTQPVPRRAGPHWLSGVGAMGELSVHDFDLIGFITGLRPLTVRAAQLSFRLGWEREDAFNALVEYEEGVSAVLQGAYSQEGKWQGSDFSLTVTGERGYVRVLRGDQVIVHTDTYRSLPADPPGNCFVAELRDFIQAVDDGTPPPISARAGLLTSALLEAIWQSAHESRAVRV